LRTAAKRITTVRGGLLVKLPRRLGESREVFREENCRRRLEKRQGYVREESICARGSNGVSSLGLARVSGAGHKNNWTANGAGRIQGCGGRARISKVQRRKNAALWETEEGSLH